MGKDTSIQDDTVELSNVRVDAAAAPPVSAAGFIHVSVNGQSVRLAYYA